MKRFLFAVLASVAVIVGYAAPASAVLIYTFDNSNSFGTGPFGTVTLTQLSPGVVDVKVSLTPPGGEGFVVTGAGDALLFNLDNIGNPSISGNITIVTPGFSLDTSGSPLIHADGSGNWEYGVRCDTGTPGCGSGGNTPNPGPLVFDLNISGLLETSFIKTTDSNNNFFASDICVSLSSTACLVGSNTGDVCTSTSATFIPPQSTPEPGSLLLLAAGLLGLGGMRWKGGLRSLRKSA